MPATITGALTQPCHVAHRTQVWLVTKPVLISLGIIVAGALLTLVVPIVYTHLELRLRARHRSKQRTRTDHGEDGTVLVSAPACVGGAEGVASTDPVEMAVQADLDVYIMTGLMYVGASCAWIDPGALCDGIVWVSRNGCVRVPRVVVVWWLQGSVVLVVDGAGFMARARWGSFGCAPNVCVYMQRIGHNDLQCVSVCSCIFIFRCCFVAEVLSFGTVVTVYKCNTAQRTLDFWGCDLWLLCHPCVCVYIIWVTTDFAKDLHTAMRYTNSRHTLSNVSHPYTQPDDVCDGDGCGICWVVLSSGRVCFGHGVFAAAVSAQPGRVPRGTLVGKPCVPGMVCG